MFNLFGGKTKYRTRTISVKGRKFRVDIADSFGKIARGLMGRDSIGRNEGMLFIFGSESRYGFWMLNMKFSIDIVWLDRDGRVVYIWKDAQPCSSIFSCETVKPGRDSRYVLEFCAGTAKRIGLRAGDRINVGN